MKKHLHNKKKAPAVAGSGHLKMNGEALMAYSKIDDKFSSFFRYYIDIYLPGTAVAECSVKTSTEDPYHHPLLPASREMARERAVWLLRELAFHYPEDETRKVLRTWSGRQEEPKDAVIGIVGIAILGPTFGIIRRKRKLDSMQVIFSEELIDEMSMSERINFTNQVSMKLLCESLERVNGRVDRLEPELQYWFISDRTLKLGTLKVEQMKEVLRNIENEEVPHTIEEAEGSIKALALSPSVRIDIFEDLEAKGLE